MSKRVRRAAQGATWGLMLGLALVSAACGHRVQEPASPAIDPELALATFDSAWSIVYRTHYDTTFNGVDWLGVREELRPRVESATRLHELRGAIQEMLDRLGQSHFGLIPKEAVDTLNPEAGDVEGQVGHPGFEVRMIDDRAVVFRVEPEGPAAAAGVRPGWILATVGEDEVTELVEAAKAVDHRVTPPYRVWGRVMRRLQGAPGDLKRLVFLDQEDRRAAVDLVLARDGGEPVKFGNLPTVFARFERRRIGSPEEGLAVGVIWFNYWMVPLVRRIDAAVDEYRELDGIVIDLRGNGGGVAAMVSGVAGHFLDDRTPLGVFRTRTTRLEIRANPRRVSTDGRRVTPYAGPVAILIDELTGSASEVFAGGLQSIDRVRVFGTTSAGAVLPATMDRLPNDDVLYHAFAEFTTARGVRLEGRGVIPDQPVPLTRSDLLAGRDAPLQAALGWIASQHGVAAGGTARDERE